MSENYAADDRLQNCVFPYSGYFVSPERKLLYCPIQKVACSSLKLWWAHFEEGNITPYTAIEDFRLPEELTESTVWNYVAHDKLNRFSLWNRWEEVRFRPLHDPSWFRFVFVRNPWARLVSCFLNKFISLDTTAQDFIRSTLPKHKRSSTLDLSCAAGINTLRSIADMFTFRKFVDHLAACDLNRGDVDYHWRPQHRFLADVNFHFVGRFERLREDLKRLSQMVGVESPLIRANPTSYQQGLRTSTRFCDCPISRLRRMTNKPDFRLFYTPSLARLVGDLYSRDVTLLGYDFDGHYSEFVEPQLRLSA